VYGIPYTYRIGSSVYYTYYQSNKTVTVISVIYTTTNPVSVWDPIAQLKIGQGSVFL